MDKNDGLDYLRDQVAKVKEKECCVLYAPSISGILKVMGEAGKTVTVFGNEHIINDKTLYRKVVPIKATAELVQGEVFTAPYFASFNNIKKGHFWRLDESIETRVVVTGGFHHTPYLNIFKGLDKSGLKFRLIIENPTDYSIHANQLTNEQIKKLLPDDPRISFIKNYPFIEADIVILPAYCQQSNLHSALDMGSLVVAQQTSVSTDLKTRYSCLVDVQLSDSDKLAECLRLLKTDSVNFEKITSGIANYNNMRTKAKIKNIYDPIFHETPKQVQVVGDGSVVNVFLLLRNNEATIGATFSGLKAMERRLKNFTFNYYFYENDSTDDTPNQIRDFFKYSSGDYRCEVLGKKHWAGNSDPRRMLDLAIYRNEMLGLCTTWDNSSYSFIVDSEISFSNDIMEKQLSLLQSRERAAMVTPYGMPEHSNTYYDTYAYRGFSNNDLPADPKYPFKVKSAFSGFVCIRSEVLRKCHWDCTGAESEQVHFCNMVNKYGDILVDPNVEVRWKK
jgi:hypothetical protein